MQSAVFFLCEVKNLLETYFIKIYGGKLSLENFQSFFHFVVKVEREELKKKKKKKKKGKTTFSVEAKRKTENKQIAMEPISKDSSTIRHRSSRHARESTPEPSRKPRISKSSDREIKTTSKENDIVLEEAKYIVRGILNVGPPSPVSSSSSSGSGSHGGGGLSGSHAYRAKLMG